MDGCPEQQVKHQSLHEVSLNLQPMLTVCTQVRGKRTVLPDLTSPASPKGRIWQKRWCLKICILFFSNLTISNQFNFLMKTQFTVQIFPFCNNPDVPFYIMKCSDLNWIRDEKNSYHITQKDNVTHQRFFPFHLAGKPWCSEPTKISGRNFKKVRNAPQINKRIFCYKKKKFEETIAAAIAWTWATYYYLVFTPCWFFKQFVSMK